MDRHGGLPQRDLSSTAAKREATISGVSRLCTFAGVSSRDGHLSCGGPSMIAWAYASGFPRAPGLGYSRSVEIRAAYCRGMSNSTNRGLNAAINWKPNSRLCAREDHSRFLVKFLGPLMPRLRRSRLTGHLLAQCFSRCQDLLGRFADGFKCPCTGGRVEFSRCAVAT